MNGAPKVIVTFIILNVFVISSFSPNSLNVKLYTPPKTFLIKSCHAAQFEMAKIIPLMVLTFIYQNIFGYCV